MTSFNALNGIPATGSTFTLRRVLRQEWKFDGVVVSDYEAITEMTEHGYTLDARDAARKALSAGVDIEMVSTSYFDHLKSLVSSGAIEQRAIDDSVRNILRLKFRLGLFDKGPRAPASAQVTSEALNIATRLATESVVLLKNEGGILPLSSSVGNVAVIGPLADSPVDQMGTWVMDGRTEDTQTPLTALRKLLGDQRVRYVRALKNSRDTSREEFRAAVEAAGSADVVLLFLGEEQILSGEAHARAFLNLPGIQPELVDAIAQTGKPIIAIILAGRPLTFHDVAAKAKAVLYAWHPGTMGGPAIAQLLFGHAVPSGKLTITFPRTVGQVPIYYAHLNTGRPPSPGDLGIPMGNPVDPQGYTSKYLDVDFTPEYPFGYGLSYTTFEYTNLRVSPGTVRMGGALTVSAEIANTGQREGDEIVQLYTRDLVGSVSRPVRELKGFRRIHLKPGEKQAVSFTLRTEDLAFYNPQMQLVTEPGRFRVWIAPDAVRGVEGEFTVE